MKKITAKTLLYAVFGDPISHSLSPIMHNQAFAHVGYDGVYTAFQVKNIKAGIDAVKTLDIKGVSITIPHKVRVMDYLDDIAPLAREIGAVNTVINRNGILSGYNSDCMGAIQALNEKTSIHDKRVAIIGAGGSARAIGFGIRKMHGIPIIVNRTEYKGKSLADELGADFCALSDIRNLDVPILINTTPVGMHPDTKSIPVPPNVLKPGMVIMDIVYTPIRTRLIREAMERNCTPISGVAMFVYQGAFQFELWTGMKAPVDVMQQVVLQELER